MAEMDHEEPICDGRSRVCFSRKRLLAVPRHLPLWVQAVWKVAWMLRFLCLNRRTGATDVGLVEGIDRSQSTFFPPMLDDYVADGNPVRAVDAFVDGLDLGKLGFGRVVPLEQGGLAIIRRRC